MPQNSNKPQHKMAPALTHPLRRHHEDRGLRMLQISEKEGRCAGSSQQRLISSRRGWLSGSGSGSLLPPQPTAPTICKVRLHSQPHSQAKLTGLHRSS